ncbi:MAG: nucleotide exchange factor GrpE [Dehalococcoidia bacterium]|nr:nucleotide exchange factor GrpE [Dehalococcoidia bacterium]
MWRGAANVCAPPPGESVEHEDTGAAEGPELSGALQRQLEEALGPAEQTPALAPTGGPLAQAEARAKEYLDLLQRTQADFRNYKKRMEQERQGLREQLRGETIARLLPVLDDLTRALGEASQEIAQHPWVRGVEMVQRKLLALLETEGVARIEAQGRPFDPWEHEAVHYQESADHSEGLVLAVYRDGYKLGGRVLRPAQVIVARHAPAAEAPSPSRVGDDSELKGDAPEARGG